MQRREVAAEGMVKLPIWCCFVPRVHGVVHLSCCLAPCVPGCHKKANTLELVCLFWLACTRSLCKQKTAECKGDVELMAVLLRTLFHIHSLTCSVCLLVPKAASGFFLALEVQIAALLCMLQQLLGPCCRDLNLMCFSIQITSL